ncbi:PREDICTED: uncharacterized protein LOC104749376 [Camelina sativa]|uniref:Uncharacterized protein LOC104749376 n=1 Tax=Camelina sativa TaxID=90675 RepID=A0ABM0WCZ1_CAMSA|nr:PREDICTED: uncharacterized protein LOC104749376 [Camelina sativa]
MPSQFLPRTQQSPTASQPPRVASPPPRVGSQPLRVGSQPPVLAPQPPPPVPPFIQEQPDLNMEEDYEEENPNHNPAEEENPIPNPAEQDYQALLDVMLALPGRQHLPILSVDPIPGVETLWFNRHKGKISRVISGIFRRKFDGPYYSWKVTPRPVQERYFRTFARKFYLDTGITELVRERFLKIAKKRMKGIVSQAKSSGKQPVWITSAELWAEMCDHWSSNASQCRNSDRGGLGVHKHLTSQKSYVQEEELGRPVSFAEVFMKTHTRADRSFVDQKAKQVAETYEKTLEERLCGVDDDGPENSENSSERSTHRTLSIDEKNDIFLKCTQTYEKGNLFGLGSLVETLRKGKRKESYAESSQPSLLELHEQLRKKIAHLDAENARREKEHQELLIYVKEKDPAYDTIIASLRPRVPATTPATTPEDSTPEDNTPPATVSGTHQPPS